jgi:ribonuclease HI
MKYTIYTDGAYSSSSKLGGIGALFIVNGLRKKEWDISEKYCSKPTNQRCELEAIRRGLEFILTIVSEEDSVEVHSDSIYSIKCLDLWYKSWEKNGWINSKKAPVENQDIIKPTLEILDKFPTRPSFKHVKGHADNEWNNEADKLATGGRREPEEESGTDSEEFEVELPKEPIKPSSNSEVKKLIKIKLKEIEELVSKL